MPSLRPDVVPGGPPPPDLIDIARRYGELQPWEAELEAARVAQALRGLRDEPVYTRRTQAVPPTLRQEPPAPGSFQEDYYPGSMMPLRPDLEVRLRRELEAAPTSRSPVAPAPSARPPLSPIPFEVPQDTPPRSSFAVTARSPVAAPVPIPAARVAQTATAAAPAGNYQNQVEACTRETLQRALAQTAGNKRQAARALGMSRSGLYKALERVGLPTVR